MRAEAQRFQELWPLAPAIPLPAARGRALKHRPTGGNWTKDAQQAMMEEFMAFPTNGAPCVMTPKHTPHSTT